MAVGAEDAADEVADAVADEVGAWGVSTGRFMRISGGLSTSVCQQAMANNCWQI
jgi:hypothetical protein